MVRPARLERATSWFVARRSADRYTPVFDRMLIRKIRAQLARFGGESRIAFS
jgi:hypothetical protein